MSVQKGDSGGDGVKDSARGGVGRDGTGTSSFLVAALATKEVGLLELKLVERQVPVAVRPPQSLN